MRNINKSTIGYPNQPALQRQVYEEPSSPAFIAYIYQRQVDICGVKTELPPPLDLDPLRVFPVDSARASVEVEVG